MRTLVFLAALIAAVATPAMVEAQPAWDDTLDSYPTGSLISGQGGWETWDNNPLFDTVVTDVQSNSAPNALLVSGAAAVVHPFPMGGPLLGDLYVQVYIPSTQAGEVWLRVANTYVAGGPHDWSVRLVMCVSGCTSPGAVPGHIVNIGGSEVPGQGSAPLPTDQWFVIWVTYNLPHGEGYNYAVGLNGVLFTPFQPWGVTAPEVFKSVDVLSDNSTAAYMDDFLLLEFVPVELMTFTVG
jgi:hypothetical protein